MFLDTHVFLCLPLTLCTVIEEIWHCLYIRGLNGSAMRIGYFFNVLLKRTLRVKRVLVAFLACRPWLFPYHLRRLFPRNCIWQSTKASCSLYTLQKRAQQLTSKAMPWLSHCISQRKAIVNIWVWCQIHTYMQQRSPLTCFIPVHNLSQVLEVFVL